MKKFLYAIVFLPAVLIAQEDSVRPRHGKFLRVISISTYGGGEYYREGFEDRTVFQQATPSSTLAFADLAGYGTGSGFFIRYGSINSIAGINVNLRLRCQQKFSELRIGIAHSVTSYAYQSYSQESRTSIGITTLPGGEIVSTDSVAYASYSYAWDTDVMHLNLAWMVRTNPRAWLNVYTGFGVMSGIGYNGVLEYDHIHTSEYQHTSGLGNMHYTTNRQVVSHTTERYSAPMITSFVAYIPMGFNLRLGKHNNFLKHIALFGEYNGAVQILSPKGVNNKVRTASSMYGGVRWYIHAPAGKKIGTRNGNGDHHRHNHHNAEDGGRQQEQPKVD